MRRLVLIGVGVICALLPLRAQTLDATLEQAAQQGDLKALQPLFAKGAYVDARNRWGATALMFAAEAGQLETVRALVEAGADVNARNQGGNTPLMMAAGGGYMEIAKLLQSRGADVNAVTTPGMKSGMTALMYAARAGRIAMIDWLVEHKANLELRTDRGETALLVAAARKQPDAVAKLLALGADMHAKNSYGWGALHFAAQDNQVRSIELLINKGAQVQDVNDGGYTPLAVAAGLGHQEAVTLLLAFHADPHDTNAIASAKEHGHPDILKILQSNVPQRAIEPVAEKMEDLKPLEGNAAVVSAPPPAYSGKPVRAVLSEFTSDDDSYRSAVMAGNVSELLQAQLANEPGVEWVARDQVKAAERELELGVAGMNSPAAMLRVGKWVKADLLVSGRFSSTNDVRSLRIEVIDLQHADVLAQEATTIHGATSGPLKIPPVDIATIQERVRTVLIQARRRAESAAAQVSIAPLFFSNTSGNHRLDVLEGDVQSALVEAAATRSGIRILQFPRAQTAAGEAELVLAGLVEQDPIAWQKVADVYVWARYEETKVDGVAFEQTPVTFTLYLWDGGDEVQTTTETVKVSGLPQLKERIVKRVLDRAQSFKKRPASETARRQVAHQLFLRSSEIEAMFRNAEPLHITPQGQQLWQYEVNLLATAHFFAPESYLIHRTWLDDRWYRTVHEWEFRTLPDLPDLFGRRCEQIDSYAGFAKTFGLITPREFEADLRQTARAPYPRPGVVDQGLVTVWSAALGKVGPVISGKETMSGFPTDAPQDVRDSWQTQMREDFAGQIFAACEAAIQATPPISLARFVTPGALVMYASALKDKQSRAKFVQDIWPSSLESFSSPTARHEYSATEFDYYFTKGLFADLRRIFTDAGRPAEAETLIEQFKQHVTIVGNPSAKVEAVMNNARKLVAIDLLPPRLKPELKHVLFPGASTVHGVVTLTAMDGTLWISTRGGPMTASDLAWEYLVSPHADPAVWRLSPGDSVPELLSPRLGRHSKVTSFCPQNGKLWATLEQDGVFCITPGTLQVARYGDKEGVLSREMFASSFVGGRLYFGGGEPNHGRLNVVEVPGVAWKRQDLGGDNGPPIVLLHPFGHNLLVNDRILDTTNGRWRSVSDVVLRGYPHRNTELMQIPKFAVLAATAGSDSLWLGTTLGLSSFNPDTAAGHNWFPLPGGYLVDARSGKSITSAPTSRLPCAVTALADDGEFLWVGATTRFDPSLSGNGSEGRWTNGYYVLNMQPGIDSGSSIQMGGWRNMYCRNERNHVLLLHKSTGKWVGYFPVTSRVTSLVVSGEKLWIGLEDTGFVTFGNQSWEDAETFAPSPLLEVEKASLLAISQDKWVSDKVDPAELTMKSQQAVQALK